MGSKRVWATARARVPPAEDANDPPSGIRMLACSVGGWVNRVLRWIPRPVLPPPCPERLRHSYL